MDSATLVTTRYLLLLQTPHRVGVSSVHVVSALPFRTWHPAWNEVVPATTYRTTAAPLGTVVDVSPVARLMLVASVEDVLMGGSACAG